MRILFITPDLESNSLGRTYALWMLAEELGYESQVASLVGSAVWEPLRGHDFATVCSRVGDERELVDYAIRCDVVIAVKPLRSSLIVAERVAAAARIPLIVDIDDPDLFATLAPDAPLRRLAKRVLRPTTMREAELRLNVARKYPTITSNPTLQEFHGGVVIPHVRRPLPDGANHSSVEPHVVFVGTNRAHKGTQVLREAIADLNPTHGIRLTITDEAPSDAHPWECWIGQTSLEDGMAIVSTADIIVLPSLKTPFSKGQLPAKLIDAMLVGRAVVVSDIDPMPWALGNSGVVVKAGDRNDLKKALVRLCSPDERRKLGAAARKRALEHFTVDAKAPQFKSLIAETVGKTK